MSNNVRDLYWDSLKFVLISLVVYGHVVGSYMPLGGFNRAIYNLIYTFHMPLFIFVSGRFSQIKDRDKYKKGILRIFETYIVFQIIWRIIEIAGGTEINLLFIAKVIATPCWTLWYLISLVWWRIMLLAIPEKTLRESPLLILAISIVVSVLSGFVPINHHFSIQRTMAFLPFFFMGYYSTRIKVKEYLNKIPVFLPSSVILICFFVVYVFFNVNLTSILANSHSYWSDSEFSPVISCIARCIFIVVAAFMGIMVMRIVRTRQWTAKWGDCPRTLI